MKLTELLTESEIHELQYLEEGPILNKIGGFVGDVAGGVSKGVGAVAGGVAGMGRAFKKGFASGKARVAGDADPYPDAADAEQPQGGNAPAPQGGFDSSGRPTTGDTTPQPNTTNVNVSGGNNTQGGNAPAPQGGNAPAPTNPAAEKAGQTLYAQVKSQIGQLDKKGKQRILALLNKSVGAPDPKAAAGNAAGAGAMGNMAASLGAPSTANTMANAPVSKTNKAKPGNPNAAPAADATQQAPAADATQQAPAADATQQAPAQEPAAKPKRTRNKKSAATPAAQPTQAQLDAEREAAMGPTSDSIIRTGNNLAETLLKAIAAEKRRMVAEGKISIFRTH